MQSVEVTTRLGAPETSRVLQLIGLAEAADGYRPVSDQFWIDLHSDGRDNLICVLVRESTDDIPIAYAQASCSDALWSVEVVIRPDHRDQSGTILRQAIDTTIRAIRVSVVTAQIRSGEEANISWLVYAPAPVHTTIAAECGLAPTRRLYQMYRSLPTNISFDLVTRQFEPGRDNETWLSVNRRAFAWNPEQGSWSSDALLARISEPWFDQSGFLLHEREGRLAGFCWTKIHAESTPALGEIYVIAVDPDFHGQGLGRDLTLAGLDSLASRGIATGMLFVDANNTAAVSLYDKLGFTVHRTDCMYQGQINTGVADAITR